MGRVSVGFHFFVLPAYICLLNCERTHRLDTMGMYRPFMMEGYEKKVVREVITLLYPANVCSGV